MPALIKIHYNPSEKFATLLFRSAGVVAAAGAGTSGLIQTFSQVVRLELSGPDTKPLIFGILERTSLAPFHGLSPTLKSLRVDSVVLQCPRVFDLVRSFPLLEDLSLLGDDNPLDNDNDPHGPRSVIPSTSPPLAGSLELSTLLGKRYAPTVGPTERSPLSKAHVLVVLQNRPPADDGVGCKVLRYS